MRNEANPEKIKIRPFTPDESETVSKNYKESNLKKPEFYTQAIVLGCQQLAKQQKEAE